MGRRCFQGRACSGCFVVRVFIYFLKTGVLGEVSREGLNRIFNSFPGVSFKTLMHLNEYIREFGITLWSASLLYFYHAFVCL